MRFEVYPKKIVVFSPVSGSRNALYVFPIWISNQRPLSRERGYSEMPTHHPIDNLRRFTHGTSLKSHTAHRIDHFGNSDIAIIVRVEIDALHLLDTFRNGLGGDKDGLGRGGGSVGAHF